MARTEAQKRWQISPKGKATQARWLTSVKGRKSRRATRRAALKRRHASEEYKAIQRGYYSSNKLSYKIRASRNLAKKNGYMPVDPTTIRPYPEDGCCQLCTKTRWQSLCLDHDHLTGNFRGWICTRCNAALGLIGDNVENLQRAILYLNLSFTP